MRRITLNLTLAMMAGVLPLAAGGGCGVSSKAAEGQPVWLLGRVSASYRIPSHRVAFAAYEEMKEDLATIEVGEIEVTKDVHYYAKGAKPPQIGEIKIPDDYPGFWFELADGPNKDPVPTIVNLRVMSFKGKTHNGYHVEVWVNMHDNGLETMLSIQVGARGNEKVSQGFMDKIAKRLTVPTYRPGSAEERVAFLEFFAKRPMTAERPREAGEKKAPTASPAD